MIPPDEAGQLGRKQAGTALIGQISTFPRLLNATRLGAALLVFGMAWTFAGILFVADAHALSEIKREQLPTAEGQDGEQATEPTTGIPDPEAIQKTPLPDATPQSPTGESPTGPTPAPQSPSGAPAEPSLQAPGEAAPEAVPDESGEEPPDEGEGEQATRPDSDAPVPPIEYDLTKLPEPVKRMRDRLIEAAKTGEVESLRPLIGLGDSAAQLSLGGLDGDPIQFLKETSGDGEGQELLAILEEVLSAGYVHMGVGTEEELYVWPYFFGIPLESLTAPQRVELFKIVTAGDYDDMKTYGAYIFYRVGIAPDGRWAFFVAGD